MKKERLVVALAGNPNVGKSTLFSAITGNRQHVGNWPGVTVKKKIGRVRHLNRDIEVVDCPGRTASLHIQQTRFIARDFIIEEKPDVGRAGGRCHQSRTEPLSYHPAPRTRNKSHSRIALIMSDMAEQRGGDQIDRKKLSGMLGVPVVRTVGSSREGIQTCSMQ
jgi:ferrous iron transport protein B